jgi:hypothetical protein
MRIYRVRFVLAGEDHARDTYIHADNVEEAVKKLTSRFASEPKEIHIESIDEDHGKFIVGSEEQTF